MKIIFAIERKEEQFSYARCFQLWSERLSGKLMNIDEIDSQALDECDFLLIDDFWSTVLSRKFPKHRRKIVAYLQTMRGLNVLRFEGTKSIQMSMAEYLPFSLIVKHYKRCLKDLGGIIANSYRTSGLAHLLYNLKVNDVVFPPVNMEYFKPNINKKDIALVYSSAPYLTEFVDPIDHKNLEFFLTIALRAGLEVHSFGRALKCHSKIFQHVNVSTKEVASLYSTSRVTFTPQLMEIFGLVPLESMSSGTPVISTYQHEALITGTNGYVLDERIALKQIKNLMKCDSTSVRESVKKFDISQSAHKLQTALNHLTDT